MKFHKLKIILVLLIYTLGISASLTLVFAIDFEPTPDPPYEDTRYTI